jgi:hypothetical protein
MGKNSFDKVKNIIACFCGRGHAGNGGSFDSRRRTPSAAKAAFKTSRYRSAEALRHPKSKAAEAAHLQNKNETC